MVKLYEGTIAVHESLNHYYYCIGFKLWQQSCVKQPLAPIYWPNKSLTDKTIQVLMLYIQIELHSLE